MSDDYIATGRSDAEIRSLARILREFFGISPGSLVDVIACLRRGQVKTTRGIKRLIFQEVPDAELGCNEGLTSYNGDVIIVAIKESVLQRAKYGDGRARMTLAHELAHAVMHNGAPKARKPMGNRTLSYIRPFEFAEHQAKIFAAAFLIDEDLASRLQSHEEIALQFGVSLEAAAICYKKIEEKRNRAKTARAIMKMTEEYHASTKASRTRVYSQARCTSCGNATLLQIGAKFKCDTCGRASDQFQDGDPYP